MAYDETRVFEYAMDILDTQDRKDFEEDLRESEELRVELKRVASMLDALADADAPVRPRKEMRERLLKTVTPKTRLAGYVARMAELFDLGTARLEEIVAAAASDDAWEAADTPGVRLMHFAGGPRVADADCGLVRLDPGTQFPHHLHNGDEWAMVIHGEAHDDCGGVLVAGDLGYMPAGSGHAFCAAGSQELILAVVVSEGITFDTK